MVVTIEDVTKLQPDEQKQVMRIEEDIDRALVRRYDPLSTSAVTITAPSNYNGRVQRKIESMYRSAGWNIKVNYDQRDGNFLSITRAKETYVDMREAPLR